MNDTAPPGITPRLILGLLVLAAGVFLILSNLELVDGEQLLQWWPVALIALGITQLVFARGGFPRIVGLGFTAVGGFLLYANLVGGVSIDRFEDYIAPIALVFFGTWLVVRALAPAAGGKGTDREDYIKGFVMMGGQERHLSTKNFQGGELTAFMGGYELDLRDADIPVGGEATLNVFALMGGVELKVPDDWEVVVEGMAFMGAWVDKSRTSGERPAKRLILRGLVMMGGGEVHN